MRLTGCQIIKSINQLGFWHRPTNLPRKVGHRPNIYVARVRSTSVRGEEIFARDENVILPRTRLHSVSHLGMFSLFPFFVNRAGVMKHSRRKHRRSAADIRQDEVSAENLPVAHILHCCEKVSAGESRNRLRRKKGLCSSSTRLRGRNLGCYPGNVMIQRRELDRESADAFGTYLDIASIVEIT